MCANDQGHNVLFSHWNKNNIAWLTLGKQRIIKHQHFDSYGSKKLKFGMIVGEFTRLARHTTTREDTLTCMSAKSMELRALGFPMRLLRIAAEFVGAKHRVDALTYWGRHGKSWIPASPPT